ATNTGALMAQAAASSVNKEMEISMERLSTGKRINGASDDAAGVAIASRLTSEIRGTNQAIRNAMDGQALIDTAEGAHEEVVNLLQRMRELAVQSINDTNSSTDRASLNAEYAALETEIDRIGATTSWAGIKLLDESAGVATDGVLKLQVGSKTSSDDSIAVTIKKIDAAAIGADATDISAGDITTIALSEATIALLDTAITSVNKQRGSLGAISNRLDSTVSNLTNISNNLAAGKGRIEDADFAAETTTLAKTQILQQASTAMLAQANASKQNVLSLLQG
ncbi:MAG: flagellin, partial [Paracoccaceae bacterium]